MNPVNPVSVSLSGNEDIFAGTPKLSNSLLSPLEANVNGIFLPFSLVLLSSTVTVQVPPLASQSVLLRYAELLQVPM